MTEPTCANCRFHIIPDDETPSELICRRWPPVATDYNASQFPTVETYDWCGEKPDRRRPASSRKRSTPKIGSKPKTAGTESATCATSPEISLKRSTAYNARSSSGITAPTIPILLR